MTENGIKDSSKEKEGLLQEMRNTLGLGSKIFFTKMEFWCTLKQMILQALATSTKEIGS